MAAFFWVWASHGYGLREIQAVTPALLTHSAPAPVLLIYAQATTLTLAAIVASQDGNVLACRSEKTSILRLGFFSNPLIWLGILIEWSLMIAIIQLPPLRAIFSTAPLTLEQWVMLLVCPPLVLGLEELRKGWQRRWARPRPAPPHPSSASPTLG